MGEDERAYRTGRMAMIAAEHDVARWGEGFLAAVEAASVAAALPAAPEPRAA
jgi:trehalose-6-phosphate synthase